MAKAKDLQELIQRSSGTRRYFLSLPVSSQMRIHEYNEHIRSAQDLRRLADFLEQTDRFGG